MKKVNPIWLTIAMLALIPLSLFSQTLQAESAFSITRSSGDGIQIRFDLPQWKLERVERGGETLHKVSVAGAQYIFIDEEETLPVFATMVAIPYSGGVSLNLLGSESQSSDQVRLDFDAALTAERNNGRYASELYPADQVLISEPQVLRDFRVVSLNIYPFQYDQASRQLIVRQNVDIRIDFNSSPSLNEIAPPQSYSSAFERIYRGLILNYDQMTDRTLTYSSPRMLVIYGNYSDTAYLNKVNEYVNWKRQKGFIVNSVSTATAGTTYTAIKTYIQNQYNNLATRPDYIVLIGDVTGSMAVPTYNSYIDYYYTWLAGGDNLGDVIIGRISVETTEQMINYMAKISSFEQQLNPDTASWLNKMVLVGDSASSGISTIYTNEYIYDTSLHVNPDYTYTKVYGSSPSSATINAAINQGVAFYNYRGYIGMSGWPSTMSSMNNAYRLFHAVFITCSTGTFGSGTSTTEAVVRYGSAATLGGAVTAIGMATSSTHTPMNNCLDVGIFHGIYPLGMRDMGEAMLYGKLYLNAVYGVSNATQAYNFAGYCNIMGDPSAAVYVGMPSSFSIEAPDILAAGTANMGVTVRNSINQPVEGVSVSLTNTSGLQVLAFTNADGFAMLELPGTLSGSLNLTVNKDGFIPASQTISINTVGGVVYDDMAVDDDQDGSSVGNSDGYANPGETIELYVSLKNTTTSNVLLTADVTCNDPYVGLISFNRIEYDDIAPGDTGLNLNAIVFTIDPSCPDQHQIVLEMSVESTAGDWTVYVPVVVNSGKLEIQSYSFVGSTGNHIFPGDQFEMTFSLTNTGSADLPGVYGILSSHDMFFTVPDTLGFFNSISQGSSATNSTDTFTVFARSTCVDGMVIPLSLRVYNADGYEEILSLTVTIGQTTVTDPLGQDAYGYFIFDEGDTAYDQCPVYDWIGIAPAEGGSGTILNLTDPGVSHDEGDQVGAVSIQTVTLPFPFTFYGVTYSQASISSNGFIAFGSTTDSDWRNWRLPDAGGPSPMIAVFWDDLQIGAGSGVYTYYNPTLHYYIVQWNNMVSGYDGSLETFQAILYDPVFYPTHTGDGQIKLQYKIFNNVDLGAGDSYPHGNFCTIGIEDHTETVGLEYTFNNSYPTAAAPLSHESALFITTRSLIPDYPYIAIEQVTVVDPNANQHLEPGESAELSIRLGNRGLVDASGVAAVLSTSDPYVTITSASAVYGFIAAQGNAYPQTNFAVTVAPNCPANHSIIFTLNITGDDGNWNYNFPLLVYVAELAFSDLMVYDSSGNQNGILDPGETANLTIRLNNIGQIPSLAGTATLTCSTPGITINTGSDTFPALAAGDFEVLSFNITASAGMTNGTLVHLNFTAVAGPVTVSTTENLEVGAPLEVIIGTGTNNQTYPLDRYYNYSAHEAIYLTSEIGMAGTLKAMAIYKGSGTDMNPIDAVSIYMKNTTASTLTSGDYSTAGYTLVYSGSYPNNAASGWMEVELNPMFVYDGISNLAILMVKGYQQWISYYPRWNYTTTPTNRARANRSDYSAPTNLSASNLLPNLRLKVFPDYDMLLPPQDLAATASHQSVLLTWSAPASGVPSSYKIFRNSSLLTTVTSLSYTDLAVTNGTTYSYYLKAVYPEGESDPSETVTATPNMYPPTNLTAVGGYALVNLNWNAAAGREEELFARSAERAVSGYRIYRNGTPITTVTGTSYQDTGLTNGVTYSYYVTTLYTNPAGESGPSNTATATPSLITYVVLGSGTNVNTTSQNAPINISDRSVHGQLVYTAAELNAAGITGPALLTQMGFNVVASPAMNIPNFLVRLKHTTANDASIWHSADALETVYANTSYMPTAGGYDMLSFTTPFIWNGTDNILVDTAFGTLPVSDYSGTQQYTTMNAGYRFAWSEESDQTNVFSGGVLVNRRYNIRLGFQPISTGPHITVNPTSIIFGAVEVGTTAVQQFTIQNTGDEPLTGNITTPTGYSVALAARDAESRLGTAPAGKSQRNTLAYNVAAGATSTFNLTFAPTAVAIYLGNLAITSNDSNNPSVSIPVSGSGIIPPAISLNTDSLASVLDYGGESTDSFVISNTGGQTLSFSITESPSVVWFSANPTSGNIAPGGSQTVTGSFSASGMSPGTYHTTLLINSNDPYDPEVEVEVDLNVNNSLPTIVLPDEFSFDEGGTLIVDFDPYVNDLNNQALVLSCSGNTNVLVDINNLIVTFSATPGWSGTETLTFTVSDGIDEASDTVIVTVIPTTIPVPEITGITSSATGVTIQWSSVTGATEYHIYRSADPYGTFVYLDSTTLTSYEDTQVSGKAFYRVVAVSNPPVRKN
ncbi:MAG: choice-of-anchor D domain-containing protein [Candidatus Syntrophosphaera sp.]|nr:choice-of-anchor D domain-containing protein [Candidatus Syntrophosphaera sp.]